MEVRRNPKEANPMATSAHKKTMTVYVVQHVHWEYNDEYYDRCEGAPLRTFLSREKAEAYAREQEQAIPARERFIEPFQDPDEPLANLTTLGLPELQERLRAVGLEPPDEEEAFPQWYYEVLGSLTPRQRRAMREVFDRTRYFEVVEAKVEVDE
jgi:hypothetical protein